jgi:glycosyltransferase involved in cell wall biosynthesis
VRKLDSMSELSQSEITSALIVNTGGRASELWRMMITFFEQAASAAMSFEFYALECPAELCLAGGFSKNVHMIQPQGHDHDDRLRWCAARLCESGARTVYTWSLSDRDLALLWSHGFYTIEFSDHEAIDLMKQRYFSGGMLAVVIRETARVKTEGTVARLPIFRFPYLRSKEFAPRDLLRASLGVEADTCLVGLSMVEMMRPERRLLLKPIWDALNRGRAKLLVIPERNAPNDHPSREALRTFLTEVFGERAIVGDHLTKTAYELVEICDIYINLREPWCTQSTYIARYFNIPVFDWQSIKDGQMTQLIDLIEQGRSNRRTKGRRELGLVPYLWRWWSEFGIPNLWPHTRSQVKVIVTSNLNQGGAQRGLVNLLEEIGDRLTIRLIVTGGKSTDHHLTRLSRSGISIHHLTPTASTAERITDVLGTLKSLSPESVCFWHAELAMKVAIVKVLENVPIRIIDVSPGPRFFEHLERSSIFAELGLSREAYFRRLDHFVSKYRDGAIPQAYGEYPQKCSVIPNGVPWIEWTNEKDEEAEKHPSVRPAHVDPRYAFVSCGRLVPAKLIERQLEVAYLVKSELPEATLTFVGELDLINFRSYGFHIADKFDRLQLENTVFFAGPHTDYEKFLPEFRCALMLSYFQGSPNASLEAMACGLPIVANDDGGTKDQIVDGETGFLVDDTRPDVVAEKIVGLLKDPVRAKIMGDAARKRAREIFPMQRMAVEYLKLL